MSIPSQGAAQTHRGDVTYGSWLPITPGAQLRDAAGNVVVPRGLLVTATGDLTVKDRFGNLMSLTAVAANVFLPLQAVEVTSGTATVYGIF